METYFLPGVKMTPEEKAAFEARYKAARKSRTFVEKLGDKRLKKKCRPISLAELKEFINSGKLNKVISVCWKNGKFRCAAKGIENIEIRQSGEEFMVSYQDDEGNPDFFLSDENTPIKKIHNGMWAFGLYVKK